MVFLLGSFWKTTWSPWPFFASTGALFFYLSGDTPCPVADCSKEEYSSHPKLEMTFSQYVDCLKKYKLSDYSEDMPCLYLKDWHCVRYIYGNTLTTMGTCLISTWRTGIVSGTFMAIPWLQWGYALSLPEGLALFQVRLWQYLDYNEDMPCLYLKDWHCVRNVEIIFSNYVKFVIVHWWPRLPKCQS